MQREVHVKTQEKTPIHKPRRNQPCPHLDLGLLSSRIIRKMKYPFLKPPSVREFIMVALAN